MNYKRVKPFKPFKSFNPSGNSRAKGNSKEVQHDETLSRR